MKPLRKKATVAKLRRWRVTIMRSRVHRLGSVEAPNEKAAEAAAVRDFGLTEEQWRRLVVVPEQD